MALSEKQIDALVAGQVLYDVHSYRMGNTTMRSLGVWEVEVVSVERRESDGFVTGATCRWNGNPPRRYARYDLRKWCVTEPQLVKGFMGATRRMTREERAAVKAGTLVYRNGELIPAVKS